MNLSEHPKIFHIMYTKKNGIIVKEIFDQRELECSRESIEKTSKSMLEKGAIRSAPVVVEEVDETTVLGDWWKLKGEPR